MNSILEKLRFHDRLVWTVGLAVKQNGGFKFLCHSMDAADTALKKPL